ncbi:MAG: hypothetical protein ACK5V3_18165 [Bdellovibrionales bacterium]
MTLLRTLIIMTGLATSVFSHAQYGVGRPIRPQPPVDQYQPYDPYRPERPERPVRPGVEQSIPKMALIMRSVRNERLALRQLANIGREFLGARVESVQVYLRPVRNSSARLELELNRRIEDSRFVQNETFVELRPRNWNSEINERDTVQLEVIGEVYIDRVIVNLSSRGYNQPFPPNPPNYGEITVPLQIPTYFPPMGRLDLTPYVDVYRYRGMVLVGVEVTAAARYNAAILEVVINSFNQGTVSLSRYQTTQVVYPRQRFVLGESLGNLMLEPRGDVSVLGVRLILRRR